MSFFSSRLSMTLVAALTALVLAACAARPPLQVNDPQVQAARQACKDVSDPDRLACIEQQAVAALNPDVCRLLGIAVDDACLQAVYQAADDPGICDRLYLPGVVSTCRAYYASLDRVSPVQPAVTPKANHEDAVGALIPYTSDELGLVVAIPAGWRTSKADFGPSAITFRGLPHGTGPAPLDVMLTITVQPATAGTSLDDVVAAQLAQYPDLAPQIRRTDGRWVALVVRHIYGAEDLMVIGSPELPSLPRDGNSGERTYSTPAS